MRYSKVRELEVDEVVSVGDELYQVISTVQGSSLMALVLRSLTGLELEKPPIIREWDLDQERLVLSPDEVTAILERRDWPKPIVKYEPGNVDGEYLRVPRVAGPLRPISPRLGQLHRTEDLRVTEQAITIVPSPGEQTVPKLDEEPPF